MLPRLNHQLLKTISIAFILSPKFLGNSLHLHMTGESKSDNRARTTFPDFEHRNSTHKQGG